MIDVEEFRTLVVRQTLQFMDELYEETEDRRPGFWSQSAENLLVGTAIQESGLRNLMQRGGGPAIGLFQMEPTTFKDIWNYLYRKGSSDEAFTDTCMYFQQHHTNVNEADEQDFLEKPWMEMAWNLRFATVMARVHYWRVSSPLPDADDVEGLARYWKLYYNTPLGHGTVEQFVENYRTYALSG